MLAVSTDSLFVRLSEAGAIDMAFLVSAFSLPVFVVLSRIFDTQSIGQAIRAAPLPLFGVAALSAASQVSFITAITRTSVANVVVIVAAAPVAAALASRIILDERTSRRVWVAMAITGSGIGIVVIPSVGSPSLDGDLLALLAIVAFAINLVLWRRHPYLSRYVGLALGAGLVLVVTAPFTSLGALEARSFAAAGAMGLLFSPAGRIAHSSAPRFAPAAEVALFAPVETVAATIWAWLAFAESPMAATIVGGTIVVAGVFYGTFGSARSQGRVHT